MTKLPKNSEWVQKRDFQKIISQIFRKIVFFSNFFLEELTYQDDILSSFSLFHTVRKIFLSELTVGVLWKNDEFLRFFQLRPKKIFWKKVRFFSKPTKINWNVSQDAFKCRELITIRFEDYSSGGFSVFSWFTLFEQLKMSFFSKKFWNLGKKKNWKNSSWISSLHCITSLQFKFDVICAIFFFHFFFGFGQFFVSYHSTMQKSAFYMNSLIFR